MTQNVITVPASRLTIAPTNVRKSTDPAADAQLKASIAVRGILQNLIGLPVARRKGEYRVAVDILVLDNATRLVVNTQIREVLKREGALAAEDGRLQVLSPAGLSDQEKHYARFYSGGQVVSFSRDNAGAGLARDTEYRVVGTGRDGNGRQLVRLVDENGRIIRWDPRLGQARQINIFNREERDLAQGDRIQWRLVNKALDLKNAERGTIVSIDGTVALIKWDRGARVLAVDLAEHKTWDHGYAETVYSSQSKTYARAYVLAPVNSGLVNAQNYYTAITRARYGVKLWTEDPERLVAKLERFSGEKTSALEGLGRLDRDSHDNWARRHASEVASLRLEQMQHRVDRHDKSIERQLAIQADQRRIPQRLASGARSLAEMLDRFLGRLVGSGSDERVAPPVQLTNQPEKEPSADGPHNER